jgi:Phosphotransferase system, mannose/fructose-specific component IIA
MVTHGKFSEGILDSINLIAGEQEKLEYLTLQQSDNIESFKEMVKQKIQDLDDGDGVLIFVDILGGSPFNVAAANITTELVECVAGLNLPMVLLALDSRDSIPLKELAKTCIKAGTEGIIDVRTHIGF